MAVDWSSFDHKRNIRKFLLIQQTKKIFTRSSPSQQIFSTSTCLSRSQIWWNLILSIWTVYNSRLISCLWIDTTGILCHQNIISDISSTSCDNSQICLLISLPGSFLVSLTLFTIRVFIYPRLLLLLRILLLLLSC